MAARRPTPLLTLPQRLHPYSPHSPDHAPVRAGGVPGRPQRRARPLRRSWPLPPCYPLGGQKGLSPPCSQGSISVFGLLSLIDWWYVRWLGIYCLLKNNYHQKSISALDCYCVLWIWIGVVDAVWLSHSDMMVDAFISSSCVTITLRNLDRCRHKMGIYKI